VLDTLSSHIAYIISEATKKTANGRPVIEPSFEASEAWADRIAAGAIKLAANSGCTPGYLNREGEVDKIPMEIKMKMARNSIWANGFPSFLELVEEWQARGDLEGIEISSGGS
jgi:hypothetical protein